MSKTSFENLEVYQLAERLGDVVWQIVARWDGFSKKTIGAQLVTAADSISANIAEGNGRFNYKDNCRFVKIARGSLYETKNWLRRAYLRDLLNADEVDQLKEILEELLPKLNGYRRFLEEKAKQFTINK